MSFRVYFSGMLLGLGACIGTARAAGAPVAVAGGIGVDEVFAGHDQHAVYSLELALPEFGAGFAPVIEAARSDADACFLGAGIAWRIEGAAGFGLRVAVCPGAYDRGEGKDLGGHFQVLSFVEGTWRVTEHGRVGLRLAHLSNASTRGMNPGTEIVGLTYAVDWR